MTYDEIQKFIKNNIKNRVVSLDNLLPDYYDNILEFQNIKSVEEWQFKRINKLTFKWLLNQYIHSADEQGLAIFENELNLPIDTSMTIRERRERLLSLVKTFEKYTKIWLYRRLSNICEKGTWSFNIDYNKYYLKINLKQKPYAFLYFMQELVRKKPANITLEVEFEPEKINEEIFVGCCAVIFGDKTIDVQYGVHRKIDSEEFLGAANVVFGDKYIKIGGANG